MSRTENSIRNIETALLCQVAGILAEFFTRRIFVAVLTQEYLGLNGTFSNILTMLSLAELGVGSAITYSLYKPLAENDREQIAALMALYRRIYRGIGLVVALLGCALAPFLSVLVRDLPDIPHIHLIYLLFVLNSALSYFFVYKQSLLIADQKQYIATVCHYGMKIILLLAQALFLWLTRNYFVYLGLQIGMTLLENLLLAHAAGRLYPYLRTLSGCALRRETKREILRNTRAMLFHKIGGVVVFGTDNLLISYFSGVVAVGLYSNYLMVTNGLNAVYGRLFSALTASVGNLNAVSAPERALPVFRRVSFAGSWLYGFSFVCLIVLFNPFIELWVGGNYLFDPEIVFLIALNFYVTGMRQAVLTFRDACGLYWYDRYKPAVEAIINLVVSIALAIPYGVTGIFIGTFVSTMTTCFWIEPVVLFKYGLKASVRPYFRDYAANTLVTLAAAIVVWNVCALLPGEGLPLFLAKMAACVATGNLFYLLAYYRREEFRYFAELLTSLLPWRKRPL